MDSPNIFLLLKQFFSSILSFYFLAGEAVWRASCNCSFQSSEDRRLPGARDCNFLHENLTLKSFSDWAYLGMVVAVRRRALVEKVQSKRPKYSIKSRAAAAGFQSFEMLFCSEPWLSISGISSRGCLQVQSWIIPKKGKVCKLLILSEF